MKLLFYLHHPAHFHLFKNIIFRLKNKHEITILASKKDILEDLLTNQGLDFINVLPKGCKNNKISRAIGLLLQDWCLFKVCFRKRFDLLIGTSIEIGHIGKILKIPSIFTAEDDAEIVPLLEKIAFPFVSFILAPNTCNLGKYAYKKVGYEGYHELAFLHPKNFSPNRQILKKYFSFDRPFFILRFVKLTAHHDNGIRGINANVALKIIKKLKPYGEIYITSERKLESKLEKYRLVINPLDIHHLVYYSSLLIGDSQSMSMEAAVLGTPSIRFNDFVGRISVLEELEHKYGLTFGVKTTEPEKMFDLLNKLLQMPNLDNVFQNRRNKMLADKIDVSAFMVWFIENYPESVKIMKQKPDYQYRFK